MSVIWTPAGAHQSFVSCVMKADFGFFTTRTVTGFLRGVGVGVGVGRMDGAGATRDREADAADLAEGRRIACPTLILAASNYLDRSRETPLQAWQRTFAPDAVAADVTSGHFPAEQNPADTLAALRSFLAA